MNPRRREAVKMSKQNESNQTNEKVQRNKDSQIENKRMQKLD